MQSELLQLYGDVWTFLPPALRRAQEWGADWFEVSTPVVVRDSGRIVAHAGVIDCEFAVGGTRLSVAAIHGVCVHRDHRGKGFGRRVVEEALSTIAGSADSIVLWSEKVEFYQRFGFSPCPESVFVADAPEPIAVACERCDLDDPVSLATLQSALRDRLPLTSGPTSVDSGWHFLINLAIWTEAAGIPPTQLLAKLPEFGGVMVFEVRQERLCIYDYVGTEIPPVAAMVGCAVQLTGESVRSVEFYFSPDQMEPRTSPRSHPDEDVLMVSGAPLSRSTDPIALSPLART